MTRLEEAQDMLRIVSDTLSHLLTDVEDHPTRMCVGYREQVRLALVETRAARNRVAEACKP